MNYLQLKASDPEISTWVSASAGTGKTKILTDRVLRLLLKDVPAHKILCLTYTNAAAGEMQERIVANMADWAKLNDAELTKQLINLTGIKPLPGEITRARNLYELYLRSEEQLNIHTIHSFCQKILKKFPIEAKVIPNFKIIDDLQIYQITEQIKHRLLNDRELELINNYLSKNLHDLTIAEIFNEIIKGKSKFIFPASSARRNISYKAGKLISKLERNFDDKYKPHLKYLITNNLLKHDTAEHNSDIKAVKDFFLTKEEKRKKKLTNNRELREELFRRQEIIYRLVQKEKCWHVKYYSQLLQLQAGWIIAEYENYKNRKSFLDYDDLIQRTKLLLTCFEAREWVLYKLDGGIEHLLIDESQDTGPGQWQIIESLISEFYSGQGGSSAHRTIFVVGDEKQSIYSFQGADTQAFTKTHKSLEQRLVAGQKKFVTINLAISYRSAPAILDIVERVFKKIKEQFPESFPSSLPSLTPFRHNTQGIVELWDMVNEESKEIKFWPILTGNNFNLSKLKLAEKIADFIAGKINNKKILPSTGKPVTAADFMILFRTRNDFTLEVIKAIQRRNLPVTGLDRIFLSNNLAVRDLLSIAKFVINKTDDLNLASLLKSPFIGLGERELYDLLITRGSNSVWKQLTDFAGISSQQNSNQQKYKRAQQKLSLLIKLYNELDIVGFFSFICDVLGAREIITASCGLESNDAIDEFLYFCYNYTSWHDRSMQNFIFCFESYPASIKRDPERTDKIRVMTVHAAKGLQAPIVILCDTTEVPDSSAYFIIDEQNKPLAVRNSRLAPEFYHNLKQQEKDRAFQEYLRLLYVGMTRAEDHLVLCGYSQRKKASEKSWYKLLQSAFQDFIKTEDRIVYGAEDIMVNNDSGNTKQEPGKNMSKENMPRKNVIFLENTALKNTALSSVYAIVNSPVVNSPAVDFLTQINFESGSNFKADNSEQKSYFASLLEHDAAEYGLIFHKVLEDIISTKFISAKSLKTTKQLISNATAHPLVNNLPKAAQDKIRTSIKKIMTNSEFSRLIQYPIKTEISVGMPCLDEQNRPNEQKIGRIDLIVFTKKSIIIIDYKSDSHPPVRVSEISRSYREQLNFYKEIMHRIYPDCSIVSKILWLENGTLMTVE